MFCPGHPTALEWLCEHARPDGWTRERVRALPTVKFGPWAAERGIRFERLYGTELHLRGATLVDLGVKPLQREQLAVLQASELGREEFTLRGWLERYAR